MTKISRHTYTIQQQIEILVKRGLLFDNLSKAEEVLGDIGYYRFGFFSKPFEKPLTSKRFCTHEFEDGTTFREVYELYSFDSQLRFMLTKVLTRVEINIRTRLTLMGSLYYLKDPWWFCNTDYVSKKFVSNFDREVYSAIKRNPAIQEHHKKHPKDKYAPAWKTMEFMTLGNLVFLYEAITDRELKERISRHYGCSIKVFLNYLETIRLVRNRCAHGGCLYNLIIDKGIHKLPANVDNRDAHNIKGAIKVILYFLGRISERQKNETIKDLKMELEKLSEFPKAQWVVRKCSNLDMNFFD